MAKAHVIVTSIIGTFHCTDVEVGAVRMRQWFRDSPVELTDPSYAFAWAADNAYDSWCDDRIRRDVWLIMDGVVADHFRAPSN